jgi:hypothetical protein
MESDWWYAMLEDHDELPPEQPVPDNWRYFKQPSGFSELAENTENLPGKRDYYVNLAKGKTRHWIKQFIEVEWGYSMNGKPVFPMFTKEIHVARHSLTPNRAQQLLIGYDPGMRCGVTFGQYDHTVGRVRILDEFALDNFATDRLVSEKIKPLLFRKYAGMEVLVIPDPSSVNSGQAKQGSSVLKELKKHFAVAYEGDNAIDSRLAPAQYYMMRLTGDGPALEIDPKCVKLIRALVGGYKYTVKKGSDGAQHDTPDKNIHSNIADSFTYLCRYAKRGEDRAGRRVAREVPRQPVGNSYAMR